MTTAETTTVESVLAELERQLSALPDPRDVPTTYRAQEEDARVRSSLGGKLRTIRRALKTLEEVEPQVAALERWRDHLTAWRALFVERLRSAGPREVDALRLSIRRIDQGLNLMTEMYPARLPLDDVMAEAGYVPRDAVDRAEGGAWLGALPYVERRLRTLTAERDDAQHRLDVIVSEHVILAEHDARVGTQTG